MDAAYGGAAALAPEMRHVLDGVERADSLVVNPHKWLFTPVDCSALYTRRPEVLRRAFSLVPEYLTTAEDGGVHNLMDYGVQLGRRFRALKLWMVLRCLRHRGDGGAHPRALRARAGVRGLGRRRPGWERRRRFPSARVLPLRPAGTRTRTLTG